jgi:hypothetical protein
MTVATRIHDALDRVKREREHVSDKQTAFDRFDERVRDVAAGSPRRQSGAMRATAGGTTSATTAHLRNDASTNRCRQVCRAFAETIRSDSVADVEESEPLLATVQEELGDEVAMALDPDAGGEFTPPVKRAVLSATAQRRTELRTMECALETEAQSLRSAIDELEQVTDWITRTNETSLLDLGFDALRERHETLTLHRTRCDRVVRERQPVLHGTTSYDASAGISHRTLVAYLYDEFPTDHPVLVTATRLDDVCADCQRVVRDHLTRRV